uniref:DUF1725 domain-containing protein n=1 Tax=Equus caballus TaxID=9796 RepID=A0A9L0RLP6_HORSE
MQTGAATMEKSTEISQKIKNRNTIRSSYSTSGYLSKEHKNTNSKRYMHPYVHCSIINNSKTWKQPKCPSIDEWIKKLWHIYTTEYYSAIKKAEIVPCAASWVDLEGIMLSKISQTEKDNYHMTLPICGR